jgi:hypothetical protein
MLPRPRICALAEGEDWSLSRAAWPISIWRTGARGLGDARRGPGPQRTVCGCRCNNG